MGSDAFKVNFTRTTVRHYRGALENVPRACAFWNSRKVGAAAGAAGGAAALA